MNVNFNGYDENVLTFEAGTNLKTAGVPVKMTDDGKVTACTSGDVFCGICLSLRGGYATVQLKGYVTMPAKSKIAVGYKKLAAGDGSAVASSTTGREYLVLNSTADSVGFIL
ncbi:hypothetical protein [Ruminococcus sp.]|uniref:hypothetical protein n=1 Tax=Ruminococcus sp. TaxID=41978 RepID=UPI0025D73EC6|nr:hypothetical protein [Ruminococcus sp.]MBD9050930.1 hypothetical protein [Ruminococcus sp.]MBD9051731.1 hypothetical protein [Ruminococcus sp.]